MRPSAYLENPANPRLQFYLVGNDSGQPPIDVPDYRTYLLRKIPRKHRESFVFTGWLAWNDFAELLPRVRLGVFPSYFESFCYALHEVYLAKVPVIVSNRPGTKDFFRHEENSLLFDGSVDDLTRQMERLAGDADLRSRLACPYPVATDPLGSFYEGPRAESWIRWGTPERPSLLVCVIEEKGEPRPPVLEPLAASQLQNMRVVRLCPADDSGDQAAAWLLGGLYTLHAQDGAPLLPTEVRTSQSLLIVRGSDMPSPGFLGRCLDTLARQPQIGFVGSWKRIVDGAEVRTDVFPLDAALELVPLRGGTPLSRCMVRTPEGKLLLDLFPTNAGRWGEMAYLWDLDTGARCGITIPEVLMTQQAEHEGAIALPTLSYLVLRDQSAWRKTRLAKYLLTMRGQAATPSPPPQPAPQPEQPLGQSAGNFPGRALRYAKRTVRHALRKLRDAPLKIAQLFKLFLYGS